VSVILSADELDTSAFGHEDVDVAAKGVRSDFYLRGKNFDLRQIDCYVAKYRECHEMLFNLPTGGACTFVEPPALEEWFKTQ
jgi:hypothetical protein